MASAFQKWCLTLPLRFFLAPWRLYIADTHTLGFHDAINKNSPNDATHAAVAT